ADAAKRRTLLPVAGAWPMEELAEALRDHARISRGRVTVAWVLMAGVNDGPDEAEKLRALLGDVPLIVNLIDVNDARPDGYKRASDEARARFVDALQILKVPVVRRYSGGTNRHAACGMLAATRFGT
ncbi:MAG TPA: RNA methyltransferase, partial [bacterium]|nr:RNA methyltransferase [bacterium]